MEVRDIVQEAGIKTIPKEKKWKKANWLSEEVLQITVKRREVKGRSQDSGGIGRGDHFLSYKFIESTIEHWKISQNNFWSLAADISHPEKQPIVFEGR